MTCFQRPIELHRRRAAGTGPRGRRAPRSSSRPSVVSPCQPGSAMSVARGTTRTCSPVAHVGRVQRRRGERRARAAAARRARGARRPARRHRVELGEPAIDRVAIGAQAVRRRGRAFVARMPAPMSRSPRARRVMSRQPLAASGRAIGPAPLAMPRRRSRRAPRRAMSGRWLIAATAGSCSRRHPDRPRADGARRAPRPRSTSAARAVAAGTMTHGRSTNRSAVAAPTPVVSRPAIGCPPTNGRPRSSAVADDQRLRARDVGDRRARGERSRSGPARSRERRRGSRAAVRPGSRARRPRSQRPASAAASSIRPRRAPSGGPVPSGVHAASAPSAAGLAQGQRRSSRRSARSRGTRSGPAVPGGRGRRVESGTSDRLAVVSPALPAAPLRGPALDAAGRSRDRRAGSGVARPCGGWRSGARRRACAPQRGQRRSSANSASSDEAV